MARNTPECSKRPSSKAAASEGARRTLRYVERLSEARTPLEDFFSILLDVDEKLKENHVIQLIRKIRDRPAIEELILVTDIHVEILREGSIHTDKESVLIKTRLRSSRTDRVQVDKDFV